MTYEKRFMELPMKITNALSLGLFGRQGESVWRVTVRFDAEGDDRTKATLVGIADEEDPRRARPMGDRARADHPGLGPYSSLISSAFLASYSSSVSRPCSRSSPSFLSRVAASSLAPPAWAWRIAASAAPP